MEPETPSCPPPAPRPRHAAAPVVDSSGPHPRDFVPSSVLSDVTSSLLNTRPAKGSTQHPRASSVHSEETQEILIPQVIKSQNESNDMADANTTTDPARRRESAPTPDDLPEYRPIQIWVSYDGCSHKKRYTRYPYQSRRSSADQQFQDTSPPTRSSSAILSPLTEERRDSFSTIATSVTGSPPPEAQQERRPYICLECSQFDAIEQELAIRKRYEHDIAKIQHWVDGLKPGVGQDGMILAALFQAKSLQFNNLRDVKSRRASEINKAWAKHEYFHGPRPDDTELDSSSSSAADSFLSNISLDHIEGSLDSMDIDEETRKEETLNIEERKLSPPAYRENGSREPVSKSASDDLSSSSPHEEMKCDNNIPSGNYNQRVHIGRNGNRFHFGRLDEDEEKRSNATRSARWDWESGGKENYEHNIDEQIRHVKERLLKRQLRRVSSNESTTKIDEDVNASSAEVPERPGKQYGSWRTRSEELDDTSEQAESSSTAALANVAAKACQAAENRNLESQIKELQLARKDWVTARRDQASPQSSKASGMATDARSMDVSAERSPSPLNRRPSFSRGRPFALAEDVPLPSPEEEKNMAEMFARHLGESPASAEASAEKGEGKWKKTFK